MTMHADATKSLPDRSLLMAYQDMNMCNFTQTMAAVDEGVNVVIWLAINLEFHNGPIITGGPNFTCVKEVRHAIETRGLDVTHLISIGGPGAAHPDDAINGTEWASVWHTWNTQLPRPFDGFDWQIQGNSSDANSQTNTFSADVLNIVVDMSTVSHEDGYIVTMSPPQSYLDHTSGDFKLSLLNSYSDWHPEFTYRGRNAYAYLLAMAPPGTFDVVAVQLYESWSKADQALIQQQVDPAEYLEDLVAKYATGWLVDFEMIDGLRGQGNISVSVEPSRLVIGLSFGSTNGESAYFEPTQAVSTSFFGGVEKPRGYSFWNLRMDQEGTFANNTNNVLHLGAGLHQFLDYHHNNPSLIAKDESVSMIVEKNAGVRLLRQVSPHSKED